MVDPYSGARVLVTGGTGSFGRAMARHLLDGEVEAVRVMSRDEAKQNAMRLSIGDERLELHLGDVRDAESVDRATAGMDLVLHAAALKQVPSCEFFPMEAVKTNIVGTHHVLEAAGHHDVTTAVCLSTDKAVMPVNAMGMTKALMEKLTQAAGRTMPSTTTVASVRYGNVLGSRGSVVPRFLEQVHGDEPLTVTEPTMTRFLMPQRDAIALVDLAFSRAESGDTFVRKSPASTLGDLAAAVNLLFDRPGKTREIGLRHGEKRHETLATREELARSDDLGDSYQLHFDGRDLNYDRYFIDGAPPEEMGEGDFDSRRAEQLDVDQIADLLRGLPEVRDALDRQS